MTAVEPRVLARFDPATRRQSRGRTVVKWITTTDHKVIGNL